MFKNQKILVGLAVLSLILSGCGNTDATKKSTTDSKKLNNETTVEITSYNYKKEPVNFTFEAVPKRVVAVYQSPIEIMLALGLEDNMVAAAQLDTDVKPEFQEAFKKIKYYEQAPSKEEVLGLNPDFIFSWYSYFSPDKLGNVTYWQDRGTNTYISQNSGVKTPNTLKNEYQDIRNMGKIFHVEKKPIS